MIKSRSRGLILAVASLALVASACSSSKSSSTGGGATTTIAAKQGGDLLVSAEQEPDCMSWLDACASAAWGLYTTEAMSMVGAYDFNDKSAYVPSPVLTGEADLVTTPAQKITYHINPKAVWSDGQPITSTDFKYTWNQVETSKNILSTSGYDNIGTVDDTDPHTAVVTMKQTYADWKSLFDIGTLPLMPSHLLQGKDRSATMKDGYTFSDGPWVLDHWTKGVEIKMVPNPMWWGKKANLASVTFKFLTDTAAEQQAIKSGQVSAAYPQVTPGPQPLRGLPGISFDAVSGLNFEGLWFNVEKAPLDSKAVRQALAYATDRTAIVSQLFAPTQPNIQPIQSVATPAYGAAYVTPFSKYKLDLAQVTTLMTGDGWAKGADGIWAKAGKKATFELKTTAGNKRRALTAQILQSQWQAAGFGLTITTEKAGVLFGQDLPSGNFQIGLYAQNPTDADVGTLTCILWCSKNIPGPANGGNGQNYDRIKDPSLDTPSLDADTNLNEAQRITDETQVQTALANLVPALPVDPFPDILVVNTDKVGSDNGKFRHNFAWGPFVYANDWYLK